MLPTGGQHDAQNKAANGRTRGTDLYLRIYTRSRKKKPKQDCIISSFQTAPPLHCSVAGGRLGLLLAAILQAPIDKALGGRALLEVLPGAHHGRVVDQRVEELPVAPGSLGTGHFQMLFLLLDQLDT